MALNWLNKILSSYKRINSNSKIIFTDGTGNFYAEGMMQSTDFRKENQSLTENETLDLSVLTDQATAMPFLSPYRIVFDYPLSVKEYRAIKSNPYGLIRFSNDCKTGAGWIDNIQYKASEGMAKFTLIPVLWVNGIP